MKKFFCVFSTLIICAGSLFAQEPAPATSNDVVQAVKEVVNVLQKYGLPFDARAARDAVVDAVIQAADPQGRLMSEADIAQMKEENKGILYEVGIRVALTNGAFVISEVKKDSAAEKAGLKAGEVVQEIDKGNIAGLKPAEVGELLRGPADQTVTAENSGHQFRDSRGRGETGSGRGRGHSGRRGTARQSLLFEVERRL